MVCFPLSLSRERQRPETFAWLAVLLHATFSLRHWAILAARLSWPGSACCNSEFFGGLRVQSSCDWKFIGLLEFTQSLLSFAVQCSVYRAWVQSFSFQGFLGLVNIVGRHT